MRRNFAVLARARRTAMADVIHLLRLQRTSWMVLHGLLPLREWRVLRRRRAPAHQRPPVLRRSVVWPSPILLRSVLRHHGRLWSLGFILLDHGRLGFVGSIVLLHNGRLWSVRLILRHHRRLRLVRSRNSLTAMDVTIVTSGRRIVATGKTAIRLLWVSSGICSRTIAIAVTVFTAILIPPIFVSPILA